MPPFDPASELASLRKLTSVCNQGKPAAFGAFNKVLAKLLHLTIMKPDGHLTLEGQSPRWLGDSRRILYVDAGTIRLLDTVTGRQSQVHAEPAPWRLRGFDLARDERSLLLLEGASESDIWMMTQESK